MIDDLPFDAAELFRSARAGLSPTVEDLARGRRRLAAVLAAGGVAAGSAAAAKAGGLSSAKLLAVALAVTTTVAGAAWWRARPVAATAPQVIGPSLDDGTLLELAPKLTAQPAREEAPPVPERASSSVPAGGVAPVAAPKAAVVQSAPFDELSRELELVRTADAALHAGDASGALAIARSGDVVQLAAELAAIEIDALCALGRTDEARDRVGAFRQRFPYSALAERVARSCEGGKR